MAINATIFKADLQIADMDRNYYAEHSLTLARHPSETDERMMVRLLAFALFAHEHLIFAKGLSVDDEPALWMMDLTGAIKLWIEVGLPDEKWVRKACGRAEQVVVICYGGRTADMWWSANKSKFERQENLRVINLSSETTQALAKLASRTMRLQCSIQDGQIWLTDTQDTVHIEPITFL